ncbi:MAG: aldehyde ferredoxin oxidoreductase family protein [Sporichthyaceae bacterium]
MTAGGYFGRALVVNVVGTEAAGAALPLPEQVLRQYLGGVGLGTWLLHELAPPGVDPLAPEAPILFVFSPLVGTPLTTSAKFAVVGKSPLTGLLTDALASSRFAIAGKMTGHDAIAIRGLAEELSVLLIDADGVRLEPAPELAERRAEEAEAMLRARFGPGWQAAVIGPAGERGVRFATISHDGRHAGRGGLGAVLGAKNLKAVLVRGSLRAEVADPPAVLDVARDLRARSVGPATSAHRALGTLGNLLAYNAVAALPAHNFQHVELEAADRLDAGEMEQLRGSTRSTCASCTIGCTHIYPRAGGRKFRMEYQNAVALGPMCGVTDPDDVLLASGRCDDYGIDTISAGGTIAWAMECAARGLIDEPWLRFGDGTAVLRAIAAIGHRSPGLGRLLAEGSRRAAEIVGGGSGEFAPHVKGLELPGFEPRTMQASALGLAVNARGADHNRSGTGQADLTGEVDRFNAGAEHVRVAIEHEDRAALMDSLILCSFLRGVFDDDPLAEWAALLRPITGWDLDAAELQAVAARIVRAKRLYNLREGATAADDTLPPRLLADPLTLKSGEQAALSKESLRAMVSGYYAARGWDPQGRPTATDASGPAAG